MTLRAFFAISLLAAGLAACSYTDVTRSGGSGMEEGWAVSRPVGIGDCAPNDINCTVIYNGKGGG